MVKCADCGFLATRSGLGEVNEENRHTQGKEANLINRDSLMCLKQELDFTSIVDEQGPGFPPNVVLSILHRERKCNSFRKWRMGFSPKEHEEIMYKEKKEESDKKWRSRQDWKLLFAAGIFTLIGGAIGSFITWLLTK